MKITYQITALDAATWRIDEAFGEAHTYAYLLEGGRRALLIDTCQGYGGLRDRVRQLTQKPVTVVYTHGHLDHIGGGGAFGEGYLAGADLPVAKEHGDPVYRREWFGRFSRELNLPLEQAERERLAQGAQDVRYLPMAAGDVFDLGGRHLRVLATPGHTPGSVCFLEEARRTLYTGDTVCARGVLLNLPHSCSVQRFWRTMQELRACSGLFDRLQAGHHEAPLGCETMEKYSRCAAAIQAGTLRGTPAVSAGIPCLVGTWEDISIAYTPDHILE